MHSFRTMIRQLVHIVDHAHSAAHATLRLQQLRKAIQALEDPHLDKIPQFFVGGCLRLRPLVRKTAAWG